jgi:hypothetical protein
MFFKEVKFEEIGSHITGTGYLKVTLCGMKCDYTAGKYSIGAILAPGVFNKKQTSDDVCQECLDVFTCMETLEA